MKKKVALFLFALGLGLGSSSAMASYFWDENCVRDCWTSKRACERAGEADCQETWIDCSARCGY
jgi:hypothetical protein